MPGTAWVRENWYTSLAESAAIMTLPERCCQGAALAGRLQAKYPPAFGVDLHVDDSEDVKLAGEEHGFHVVVVKADDKHWAERILNAARSKEPTRVAADVRWL